jgi:hypothetical protein
MTLKGNRELADVLAAAGAITREQDEQELAAILAVFNMADPGPFDGARPGARAGVRRPKRVTGRFAVKCTAALVLVVGCAATAAGAGVLPSPVQRLAHDMLGGVGIPAPDSSSSGPGGATVSGGASAAASGRGPSASLSPRTRATPGAAT